MQAKLFCKTGPLAGTSYDVQGEATIGKSPGNSIQLTPAIISGKHARIVFDPKKSTFFIEDLGSTNGTWVDGMRVKGKERLDTLNIISFADSFDFVFQVIGQGSAVKKEAASVKPEPAKPAMPGPLPKRVESKTVMDDGVMPFPAINPQQQVKGNTPAEQAAGRKTMMDDGGAFVPPPQSPGTPQVNERPKNATVFDDGSPLPQFTSQKDAGKKNSGSPAMKYALEVKSPAGTKTYDLNEGENFIGRESSCSIFVEDSSMSRKHAVIMLKSGELTINDLDSKNGTFLGTERVSAERKLRPGDDLQFGNIIARLSGKPIL